MGEGARQVLFLSQQTRAEKNNNKKPKQKTTENQSLGAVCESRGGRPGLPDPNKPTVSVDVKQH